MASAIDDRERVFRLHLFRREYTFAVGRHKLPMWKWLPGIEGGGTLCLGRLHVHVLRPLKIVRPRKVKIEPGFFDRFPDTYPGGHWE